ncbi:hypothetical protein KFK14_11205 [Sphingobium phenoxybenzoativorans]|uniref:Uncharacterized protein n=1 Tax=Sphingobium phenoxybenzoativorans TaxID=1592790 RepID=A0A975KAN4_9SPHN|nr:hypothetical protein [Sphingobium phenoxybenzoativorans]QUT07896.1 hypothetical protein KFK14_11205 [Sphingobium phenoxybenzoativorans]
MHYLNGFVPDVECTDCDGNGFTMKRQPRLGPGIYEVECGTCCGHGWRPMTDDELDAAAERQAQDAMSEPPVTLDEQHRAAWQQKQDLRR